MEDVGAVMARAERKRINLRYFPDGVHVGVSFHECTLPEDFQDFCEVLGFTSIPWPSMEAFASPRWESSQSGGLPSPPRLQYAPL